MLKIRWIESSGTQIALKQKAQKMANCIAYELMNSTIQKFCLHRYGTHCSPSNKELTFFQIMIIQQNLLFYN